MAKPSADDQQQATEQPTDTAVQQGEPSGDQSQAPSAEGSAPTDGIDEVAQQEQVEELVEAKPSETIAVVRAEYNVPLQWSDEEILEWVKSIAALPQGTAVSKDGIFFNDPTRAARLSDLTTWPTEELVMALKGELLDVADNKLAAIIKELRNRNDDIPAAWSYQQVLDFYRQGVTPEKTENGVWVQDITRPDRPASSWTTAELEAWANGWIKSTNKATEGKLANELKQRLKLPAKSNLPADVIAAYLKQASTAGVGGQTTVTPVPVPKVLPDKGLTELNISFIDSTLERYADAVAVGKPVTPETGQKATTALENMFQYVIKLEDPQAMVSGLERIKAAFVKEKDGLFSPSNAHRFDHLLRREGGFADRHTSFVEAMIIYASDNKEQRKQCDVRMLLSKQPANKVEQLVEYFTKVA